MFTKNGLQVIDVFNVTAALAKTSDKALCCRAGEGDFDGLEFKRVDILTPAGKMLARELSFKVVPGQSILVTGPNGSGKSSLFRILGGLWPQPSGTIRKPGRLDEALDTKVRLVLCDCFGA